MTVFDNVAYGLRGSGQNRALVTPRVEEALKLVGLSGYGDRYGTELSGGQQQRVAVARAVVTEPRLLLFDEPLSNLDAGLRERMRIELLQLQRRLGRTSIYVTHDQSEAMAMSDRIILMDRGHIVQEGSPRDLYERPASHFAAAFIGNANLLDARIVSRSGDAAVVRLGETLELRATGAARVAGNSAIVCIRPENIVVGSGEGANHLEVRVERVTYLGASLDCELTGAGLQLRANMPSRPGLTEGATLTVAMDPACVVLVPNTSSPASKD